MDTIHHDEARYLAEFRRACRTWSGWCLNWARIGFSALYMDGPVAAGARRVSIDFSGWASGISIGIAGTVRDLSLIDQPNQVTPDYYQ